MVLNGKTSVMVLLFIASVINYLDRSALSIVAPFIQSDLNLTPTQMGIVFSSFSVGYAVFNFVGGVAADRYGAKLTLLVAMIVWSMFSGAVVLATGIVSLIIIRVLFGMGEGPLATTTNKMIYNWFPPDKRASAVGITYSGQPLGGAIAGPIVGLIAVSYGWKASFIIIMIIGLVWSVAWWLLVKESPNAKTKLVKEAPNTAAQKELAVTSEHDDNRTSIKNNIPLSYYLKQKTILFTSLAYFAFSYILFFFLTWFPSFLLNARGLNIKELSFVNVIPWVFGIIGMAFGGILSDFIFKKFANKGALFSRKVVLVVCLFISAVCIGLAGIATTTISAVSFVTLSVLFMYLTAPVYWAIIQDVVDKKNVGSVGGFMHFIANTAGIIAPTLTGYLIQVTGTYTSAFLLAGSLAVVASISVIKYVKPLKLNTAI